MSLARISRHLNPVISDDGTLMAGRVAISLSPLFPAMNIPRPLVAAIPAIAPQEKGIRENCSQAKKLKQASGRAVRVVSSLRDSGI